MEFRRRFIFAALIYLAIVMIYYQVMAPLPADKEISSMLPKGKAGWVIEKKRLIRFFSGEKYLVVAASRRDLDDFFPAKVQAQIFIFEDTNKNYFEKQRWLEKWHSPMTIAFMRENKAFRDLKVAISRDEAFIIGEIDIRGNRKDTSKIALELDNDGKLRLYKIGSLEEVKGVFAKENSLAQIKNTIRQVSYPVKFPTNTLGRWFENIEYFPANQEEGEIVIHFSKGLKINLRPFFKSFLEYKENILAVDKLYFPIMVRG